MKLKIWFVVVMFAMLILSACQLSTSLPTPTAQRPSETATPTSTRSPTNTPTQTSPPTETLPPTNTPLPSNTPTATPPTFVRENTPIPVPSEPITAENADRLVELARLGKGRIVDVQLSPDRNYLIVQTTIGVYGYSADRQEERWRFEDPAGIADMALTRTERWMAVATNDGRIALLIYRRGSMFTRWATGYQQISDLSFSYDGDQLAAVGDQGVTVWQVGETEPLVHYPEMQGERVRFTPDGEGLIVTTNKEAFFSNLLNGSTLSEIEFDELGNPVFAENGLYFSDGFTVWDGNTAEVVLKLDYTPIWGGQPGIAFSRDGELIAVGLVGSLEVFIWNIEQKELKLHLLSPNNEALYYTNGKVASPAFRSDPGPYFIDELAFSPNEEQLAVITGLEQVELWDLRTGRYQSSYQGDGNPFYISNTKMVLWDDQSLAQYRNDLQLKIYETLAFRADGDVFFSPEDNWLFSRETIWDISSLTRIQVLRGETILGVALKEDEFYSFSYYPMKITSWSRTDFSVLKEIQLSTPSQLCWDWEYFPPIGPILSSEGDYFGASFSDCGFMFWDLRSNEVQRIILDPDWSHSFSPDGSFLILTDFSGTKIFASENIANGDLLSIPDEYGVAYSRDNQKMLVVTPGNILKIYSIRSDGFVEDLQFGSNLSVGMDQFGPAIFSLNNDFLLIADEGELLLVETSTGELLARIPAHFDKIASLAFSPDGRYLATSSYDGTVKLWGIP